MVHKLAHRPTLLRVNDVTALISVRRLKVVTVAGQLYVRRNTQFRENVATFVPELCATAHV